VAIRRFGGPGKLFFVHLRDVRGVPDKFVETFHDDGQTDMAACIRAHRDVGFDGPAWPDHVPTMAGDTNDVPGSSGGWCRPCTRSPPRRSRSPR
jgi:mannonate dehydratase